MAARRVRRVAVIGAPGRERGEEGGAGLTSERKNRSRPFQSAGTRRPGAAPRCEPINIARLAAPTLARHLEWASSSRHATLQSRGAPTMFHACEGCRQPIRDRYMLSVLERTWHERCLSCARCGAPLADRCYAREGQFFCADDYFRTFGPKCSGCGEALYPNETVQKTPENNYHVKCFVCVYCRRQLSAGDEYYASKTCPDLVCKDDFQRLKFGPDGDPPGRRLSSSLGNTPQTDDADEPGDQAAGADAASSESSGDLRLRSGPSPGGDVERENSPGEGRRGSPLGEEEAAPHGKRRGPRTTIKAKQLETLKAAFAATPKPTRHIRERLAQETGLSMRVIQVWFQNRRSKERRLKQLNVMGARRGLFRPGRRLRALRVLPDDLELPLGPPLHPSGYPGYAEQTLGLGGLGGLSLRHMAEYLAVAGDHLAEPGPEFGHPLAARGPGAQDLHMAYYSTAPDPDGKPGDACALDGSLGHPLMPGPEPAPVW